MKSLMGNYFDGITKLTAQLKYPLSYLSDAYGDVDEWRGEAKSKVRELLSYNPPDLPLDAQVHDTYVKDGLIYKHVSYAQPIGPRTEGILMYPENAGDAKLPGIIGLHDHGGFKYYGKEKITSPRNAPEIMQEYQAHYYGGRAWASELAKHGYIVFVPDVFLWGSRKMQIEQVMDEYSRDVVSKPVDSREYVEAYNRFAGEHETHVAKTLIHGGMSWPGIMLYDDMRAVDFLLTQPQTDAENIGCGGLSGGGLRTVYLAGMDDRIKCGVCVGFMCTTYELAAYKIYTHTWMMYLPGLSNLMDFPDIYSLRGKKPTMVLYDIDDQLFTKAGQEGSHERLTKIYEKMGAAEMYEGRFYPGFHKYDIEMQEDAFKFYDKWLKK